MKKKKLIALILSLALAVTGTMTGFSAGDAKAADYELSNPRVDSEGNVTWDCAYFGSYYQTAQWEKEPIKWRVLSVDENNNALIVADKNLDCKPYNETYEEVTWETCTLRSWLNGYGVDSNSNGIDYSTENFIDEAFTEEEQAAINTTTVINSVRVYNDEEELYEIKGGNNTEDKVYLLSIDEVGNAEYGFDGDFRSESKTREAKNTDYTRINGADDIEFNVGENGEWWLCSSSGELQGAYPIDTDGEKKSTSNCESVDNGYGVRPALRVNLSSLSVWTDAETMDSDGNDGVSRDNIINNPVVENGVTIWDCIYFGKYNQTAKWVKEPIKWRVLSVDGDDAFFLADKSLDCKAYNETYEEVTWETSTLRSWLNGYGADCNGDGIDYSVDNFINEAFTEEEQLAINTTTVINNDNLEMGIDGGNDTEDKIYLLSVEEASNTEYGFCSTYDDMSTTRLVEDTDRVKYNSGYRCWWLRSPGWLSSKAYCVWGEYGIIDNSSYCSDVYHDENSVRPVLHINLSSSVWEEAGTVTSNAEVVEPDTTPTEQPETNPSSSPQPTQAPVVTQTPALIITQAPVSTVAPTETPKDDDKVKVKTFKLSSLKIKKNSTKITGKLSVSKATVKIKVGSKAWKRATVKGKKFTLKTAKLKKNTKVQIKISKKGYKTLKKSYKVK